MSEQQSPQTLEIIRQRHNPQPLPTGSDPNGIYTQPAMPSATPAPGWKPYAIGALITAALLVMIYQQVRINTLSEEIGLVSSDIRSIDMRGRVNALETQMGQVDKRMQYLDTKAGAADKKAQAALDKFRAQEERGGFVLDLWKRVTDGLGF